MESFLHTPDGHLRGLSVAACCYGFNALLNLVSDGLRSRWRSISWMPWFLLALGFLALDRAKWPSLTALVGAATTVLGLGGLVFEATKRLKKR